MISKHAFFSFSPHTYISINNSYDPDDIRKLSVNSITLRYSSVTCFLCSALILMLIHVDGCSCLSFIFTLCSFTLYEYVIIYPISCWKTCELFLSFLQLHTALNPNVLVCVSSYPGVGDALFRTGLFWVTGCKHLDITRLLTAGASPPPLCPARPHPLLYSAVLPISRLCPFEKQEPTSFFYLPCFAHPWLPVSISSFSYFYWPLEVCSHPWPIFLIR